MPKTDEVLVWDWSLRLSHWAMVLLVAGAWWTAEQGLMDWHRRLGLTLVGVLVFRTCIGIFGPTPARLDLLFVPPGKILQHARGLLNGRHKVSLGHNPLGGLSVLAMLLTLTVQTGTGLFAIDVDGLESGPLATLVSFDTGRLLADIHETSFNILLGLIGLHLVAITVYVFILKDNILTPMITGRRPSNTLPDRRPETRVRAWVIAVAALAALVALVAINKIG